MRCWSSEPSFGAAAKAPQPGGVEALPPGYAVVHDFLPDIEGFYRGWLGRELAR